MSPRRPTSYLELLLLHPFELFISFMTLLVGLRSISGGDRHASALVNSALNEVLLISWHVTILAGSLGVLFALLSSPRAARKGIAAEANNRLIEQVGLVFIATAAMIYALIVAVTSPGAAGGYAVGMSLGVSLACGFRVARLRLADKRTLHRLETISREIDAQEA
jgi:hypothetical protein